MGGSRAGALVAVVLAFSLAASSNYDLIDQNTIKGRPGLSASDGGQQNIFVTGQDDEVWIKSRVGRQGAWTPYAKVQPGAKIKGSPAAAWAFGKLFVFVTG